MAGRSLKRKDPTLLLIALPFVALVLAFSYVPLFGWVYSFFDYKPGIALRQTPWVGLKWFTLLFQSGRQELVRVMTNTFALSLYGLAASVLPVILAILLNEVRARRFKRFVQTTTTLPNFISWVIVYSLAITMFGSDGVVNTALQRLGLITRPLNVIGNPHIVWSFQTALGVWKSVGWGAIIYLAAIAGIDVELYDAARVDGAGRLRTILHVTVPGIATTYLVLLLLQLSNLLSAGSGLDQYLVFYNALVADRIEVLDYYVYRMGISYRNYAYSTAIGIIKTLVSLVLLFGVNRLSKRLRGQSII